VGAHGGDLTGVGSPGFGAGWLVLTAALKRAFFLCQVSGGRAFG